MKAMLLERPAPIDTAPLRPVELPDPVPGERMLRLRVEACGICRTDLHVVEGDLPPVRESVVPGHQIVGRVDRLGPGARRFALGARVGIAWLRGTCGECARCRIGRENLCESARFTGYHEHGGYAERAVVHEDFAYAIPEPLDAAEATPLLCAGIIGFRALKRAEIRPGCRLGLYGFGASAHIAIQVARHLGCEVYVMTRDAATSGIGISPATWAPSGPGPQPIGRRCRSTAPSSSHPPGSWCPLPWPRSTGAAPWRSRAST
jgi:propanol-preferring alcohol dehydrogenase